MYNIVKQKNVVNITQKFSLKKTVIQKTFANMYTLLPWKILSQRPLEGRTYILLNHTKRLTGAKSDFFGQKFVIFIVFGLIYLKCPPPLSRFLAKGLSRGSRLFTTSCLLPRGRAYSRD